MFIKQHGQVMSCKTDNKSFLISLEKKKRKEKDTMIDCEPPLL